MDISVNTSATFSCKPGFRLNDSSSLLCQIDGTWNGTLPSCSGTLKWTYSVYNLHHGRGNNVLFTDTVLKNEENLGNGRVKLKKTQNVYFPVLLGIYNKKEKKTQQTKTNKKET